MSTRVFWKPHNSYGKSGIPTKVKSDAWNSDPSLLNRILAMPKGRPIHIDLAYHLYWEQIMFHLLEDETDQNNEKVNQVHDTDWVKWVSLQGYQIVLTGDEYEF